MCTDPLPHYTFSHRRFRHQVKVNMKPKKDPVDSQPKAESLLLLGTQWSGHAGAVKQCTIPAKTATTLSHLTANPVVRAQRGKAVSIRREMFLMLNAEHQHMLQCLSKFRSHPGHEFKIYSCAAPASVP